jgi:hypothetical protein
MRRYFLHGIAVMATVPLVMAGTASVSGAATAAAKHTVSPTLRSALSSPTASVGSTVTDTATLIGKGKRGAPTGTVTFGVCGPTSTATPCASPNVGSATVGLTTGAKKHSTASVSFSPNSTGWFCFLDQYGGDAHYKPVSDNDTSTECLHVTSGGGGQATPGISSALNPASITVGSTTTDTVTLTGNATKGSPTGNVTFYVCGATSSPTPCNSTANGLAIVGLSSESGNRSVASLTVQVESGTGWFCFLEQYSGDSNYKAVSDNDSSTECVHVTGGGGGGTATPTIKSVLSPSSMTVGGTTTDIVTLTGNATSGSPTGNVTFYYCGPTSSATPCNSTANGLAIVGLSSESGNRSFAGLNIQIQTSGWFCFLEQYSGDSNYKAVSDNDASTECVHVTNSAASAHRASTASGVQVTSQSAPPRSAVTAVSSR